MNVVMNFVPVVTPIRGKTPDVRWKTNLVRGRWRRLSERGQRRWMRLGETRRRSLWLRGCGLKMERGVRMPTL